MQGEDKLAQDRIKKERQRLVLCRLMVDIMRTVHGAYAPVNEPFGTRIETFFIALCVAIGDMDGRPFSVAKIAAYMRVPRTTVIRRLDQLRNWGVIDRRGRHYYLHERALNSLIGMKSYQQVRRILGEATKELSVLDALPNADAPAQGLEKKRSAEVVH
jgi:biotin operon repressor